MNNNRKAKIIVLLIVSAITIASVVSLQYPDYTMWILQRNLAYPTLKIKINESEILVPMAYTLVYESHRNDQECYYRLVCFDKENDDNESMVVLRKVYSYDKVSENIHVGYLYLTDINDQKKIMANSYNKIVRYNGYDILKKKWRDTDVYLIVNEGKLIIVLSIPSKKIEIILHDKETIREIDFNYKIFEYANDIVGIESVR